MKTNRVKYIVFAAAAMLLAAGISRCGGGVAEETAAVVKGEAVRAVYATGVVEPAFWAKLGPYKTGRVIAILKDEGQAVQRGEPVAQMDSGVEEDRLREAEAQLAYASKELERKRTLVAKGAISSSQFDNAERSYKEARARVNALANEAEDLKLVSPIDGIVLRRDVEPGETVEAGRTVFWIGKEKPLRITADVDEEDIGQVRVGQSALIKADAFAGQVFEGTVSEITPKGDPVNKVFRIRVALPDDLPLMVSMTTEVNIISEKATDALLIPTSSESGGKVWRVDGGSATEIPIKTGIRGKTQVQVLEGLEEGDVILREPPARRER